MNKKFACAVVTAFLFLNPGFIVAAEDKEDIGKISETMGHLIGKNLQSLGLPLDLDALVKGMQDEASGITSPLADEEYERAISILQEKSHEKAALENLQKANDFLQKNQAEEGVVSLEKGKLQYRIQKEGSGRVVQSYNTPLIRYQGKALNGELLQPDYEEELIPLDEALPGLKQGMVGMKEGEKRLLFIHPDLGYGKESYVPNSLLIFDIEVIKADTSAETQAVSNADTFPVQLPSDNSSQ